MHFHAISLETLTDVRRTGRDVSGHPVESVVAEGGEPLRCCLRDARPGEELILFGYAPDLPASPYSEIGPVFAHAASCPTGPEPGYPADFRGRRQVLRAYDARGWIHPATRVHDGADPEAELAAMLADPSVDRIHSRNVSYGCYMFAVTR
ncbi:DUF1203 domain-containing protein [Asanoa sp. WMMD1127]|uniref:DUF1203 domain-containing protein n=1 Tax=Asanoa sp. WMMD1127 TaxID=3016107 RepID=UPI0024169701|nr:DUF1203 domain-containing protein [Asanoa sp. WMMD1127]MDG4821825.1 DUF1203 domain-containing protein [Asanoa sp. WMMD1127]